MTSQEVNSYHFVVGHELEDAGSNPTPELQARKDGAGWELGLVLVLERRRGGRLLAVDGPQLGEHESVEQGAHVQHRRLQTAGKKGVQNVPSK